VIRCTIAQRRAVDPRSRCSLSAWHISPLSGTQECDMTYRSLKYTLIPPIRIRRFLDLSIRRLRVDNPVLPRDLFAIPPLIADLLLPIFLQLFLKAPLQLPDLRVLDGVIPAAHGVRLKELNLVLDGCVKDLRLRDHRLELGGGARVRGGEGALVRGGDLPDVRGQGADVGFDGLDAREEVLVREDAGPGLHVLDLVVAIERAGLRWRRLGLVLG